MLHPSFFERCGITRETVRREVFVEDESFVDGVGYALLQEEWPAAREHLTHRLREKLATR